MIDAKTKFFVTGHASNWEWINSAPTDAEWADRLAFLILEREDGIDRFMADRIKTAILDGIARGKGEQVQ